MSPKPTDRGIASAEARATDMLAGRTRPTPALLAELIREVNPTGRELSSAASARRYRLKSQLQSLLVRRFADQVEVAADKQEGIVLLRHGGIERGDAAHAVIAELDDDARSIVQRRLDDAATDDPKTETKPATKTETKTETKRSKPGAKGVASADFALESKGETAAELLSLGRAAMANYDFEEARSTLEAALSRSAGGLNAARALLELLVDHLADDQAALSLESQLSTAALEDSSLRAILATAAGRSGDRREVERWLRGVSAEARAPAFLALAAHALSVADEELAAASLASARAAGAATADLVRHEAEVATLRREKWRDADVKLELEYRSGAPLDSEARAAEVLRHWPEAPGARRVLATLKQHRQTAESERLLAEAAQSLGRGDTTLAAERAFAARSLGADTTFIAAAIHAEIEAARQRREQAQVDAAISQLAMPRSGKALLAYLELPVALRAAVRRVDSRAALGWLDQIGSLSSARAAAAIEAILLFEGLTTDDPAEVVAALAPHEEALDRIPAARVRLAEARAAITARRRLAAEAQLEAAWAVIDTDPDEAGRLLGATDRRLLSESGRERARVIDITTEALLEVTRHAESIKRLLSAKEYVAAACEIPLLMERIDPADKTAWRARFAEVVAKARRQWPIYSFSVAGAPVSELPMLGGQVGRDCDYLPVCEIMEQDLLVLARSYFRWLFIYAIDIATRQLRKAIVIRLPSPTSTHEVTLHDEQVWVVGGLRILAVNLREPAVTVWRSLLDVIPAGRTIDSTHTFPESGFLWARLDDERIKVVDLRRWRRHRDIRIETAIARLRGGPVSRVTGLVRYGAHSVPDTDGTQREEVSAPDHWIHLLGEHPSGGGRRIAVISRLPPVAPPQSRTLSLSEIGRAPRHELRGAAPDGPNALAILSEARLALVACGHGETGTTLHAFDAEGDLTPLWQVEVPHRFLLAQDGGSRRALALYPTARGLALFEPGKTAPKLDEGIAIGGRLPVLQGDFSDCSILFLNQRGLGFAERFVGRNIHAEIEGLRREYAADVEMLIALNRMLVIDERARHLEFIEKVHPGNLVVELQRAELDAALGDWPMAGRRLEAIPVTALPQLAQRHCLHLLGIARLQLADYDGARVALQKAQVYSRKEYLDNLPGDGARAAFQKALAAAAVECQIDECLEWVDAITDRLASDGTHPETLSQRIARALRAADACLNSGDPAGARRALEHPAILAAGEGQTLARLAVAYLALSPVDDLARIQKAHALAQFCAWCETKPGIEVVLPGVTWDAARLSAICLEADDWLESEFPQGQA